MDDCRRPIADEERPRLRVLGASVRGARTAVGLTQAELGEQAQLGARQVGHIERGTRRTRESTLARLAHAVSIAEHDDWLDDDTVSDETWDEWVAMRADELVDKWVMLAGVALAPESAYQWRVDARRRRRWGKRRREQQRAAERALHGFQRPSRPMRDSEATSITTLRRIEAEREEYYRGR